MAQKPPTVDREKYVEMKAHAVKRIEVLEARLNELTASLRTLQAEVVA